MKLAGTLRGASPTKDIEREGSHRPDSGPPCASSRLRAPIRLAAGLCALILGLSACSDAPPDTLSPASGAQQQAVDPALQAPDGLDGRTGPELGAEEVLTDPAEITRETLRRLNDPERFRGKGSLRGRLGLPGGGAPTADWIVTVEPSRTLAGREQAVERRLELPASATEFELASLPLGGYDLRVRTDGYASLAQAVLLERGSEHPYVQVALLPLGTVRGRLLDDEDRPLEGRTVFLKLRRSGMLLSTESVADGTWFFEGVEPGAWTLLVDSSEHPTLDPLDFDNTGARSSNLGDLRLPVTGSLLIEVTDEFQVGLPEVKVVGYSMQGASFDALTDHEGKLTISALQLGEWKIMAVDERAQRDRETIELSDGEPVRLLFTLPR